MKTITYTLLALMLLGAPTISLAQIEEGHNRSINDVVNEIAQSQNVSGQSELDCNVVTDEQFEELGDAVMQAMIGDDEAHEVMDNMMGGEGSESLQSIHISMGQRYLGCAQGAYGTMGMMGGMMSMMGTGGWQGGNGFMMGNSYSPWGMMSGSWGIGMILFWIIVIVAVVFLVKWLISQSNQKGSSALDILKRRYAKGEITKEEFEVKKKDVS